MRFGFIVLIIILAILGPAFSAEIDEKTEKLIRQSLERDISTAPQEELEAWCHLVELDETGSEDQLRERLRGYYGLEDDTTQTSDDFSGSRVTIESAQRSDFFKVDIGDGIEESVLRLSGDVVLTIEENKSGSRKHNVHADSILFNQNTNTISAIGNIEYTIVTNGKKEQFSGESLVFGVTDWNGLIFRGTSERQEKIKGKVIDFFFKGESIKRSGSKIMVLSNGSITSDKSENPEYLLKAKKIWITGSKQWGVLSATIYVGHIPVFYIPFYWKSGRDLFFNPVIGQRTGDGFFIQNTLYLIGQKGSQNDFSFFGFSDISNEEYTFDRKGLFLVPRVSSGKKNRNFLKYTLDAYSGLGFATGFEGSFSNIADKDLSISFFTSLGASFSRKSNGSPYYSDGSKMRMYWNNSYIKEEKIPLRWGAWTQLEFDEWTLEFNGYSDPYYNLDFGNRSENFDWLKLLKQNDNEESIQSPMSTMKWAIDGSYSFDLKNTSPWLESMSLSKIEASLSWASKNNEDITNSSNPDKNNDPARSFFYPNVLILPNIKFSLKGSFPTQTIKMPKTAENIPKDSVSVENESSMDNDALLVNPSDRDEEIKETPSYVESYKTSIRSNLLVASLNYNLNPNFFIEGNSPNKEWNKPSDLDFKFNASQIDTSNDGNLNLRIAFLDNLFDLGIAMDFIGNYRTHKDLFNSGEEVDDATKLQDYKYSKFLWDSNLSLNINPLRDITALKKSNIKYKLDVNLFSYQFDDSATIINPSYVEKWISSKEEITQHDIKTELIWNYGPLSISSSFTNNLPPLEEYYAITENMSLKTGGWEFSISQKNLYEEDEWNIHPLELKGLWSGWKNKGENEVSVSQKVQIDLDENRLSLISSELVFWGFKTTFEAAYGETFEWDDLNYKWVAGVEKFRPSMLNLAFTRIMKIAPFWKNRITTEAQFDISWTINLTKPTINVLRFSWTQHFHIHRFLDLRITAISSNNGMYLYFKSWREKLNIKGEYSFFGDLLKSFNFFNEQERLESLFKMEKIDVTLIHNLRNWDLEFTYSGIPEKDEEAKKFKWKSEFSIFVKWYPLPILSQKTAYKEDKWSVESFK